MSVFEPTQKTRNGNLRNLVAEPRLDLSACPDCDESEVNYYLQPNAYRLVPVPYCLLLIPPIS